MNALLIVAHGSRRQASNEEIRQLTNTIAQHEAYEFDTVACGFLELAEPSIGDAITQLVDANAESITVIPYFLACGTHVSDDIPAEIAKAAALHPDVTITVTPYFGSSSAIAGLMLGLANAAGSHLKV